ncbi:hypothetical protein SLEP1_g1936 [Rubroshorea leprosula]|uniref:Uncharacterized protein n=1 Tax=Rubroshorea leprosula TaxID=152421 RepID=A0AAV5HQU2_9ROSI|nr:hypothetical protein SLEP1_g1936 [Rubroshorea leprosula]
MEVRRMGESTVVLNREIEGRAVLGITDNLGGELGVLEKRGWCKQGLSLGKGWLAVKGVVRNIVMLAVLGVNNMDPLLWGELQIRRAKVEEVWNRIWPEWEWIICHPPKFFFILDF